MKQETVNAVDRHIGELYDAEEVATCVDLLTGKVEESGGGMPMKEYWARWKESEAIWIHDNFLPSITIGKDGEGTLQLY